MACFWTDFLIVTEVCVDAAPFNVLLDGNLWTYSDASLTVADPDTIWNGTSYEYWIGQPPPDDTNVYGNQPFLQLTGSFPPGSFISGELEILPNTYDDSVIEIREGGTYTLLEDFAMVQGNTYSFSYPATAGMVITGGYFSYFARFIIIPTPPPIEGNVVYYVGGELLSIAWSLYNPYWPFGAPTPILVNAPGYVDIAFNVNGDGGYGSMYSQGAEDLDGIGDALVDVSWIDPEDGMTPVTEECLVLDHSDKQSLIVQSEYFSLVPETLWKVWSSGTYGGLDMNTDDGPFTLTGEAGSFEFTYDSVNSAYYMTDVISGSPGEQMMGVYVLDHPGSATNMEVVLLCWQYYPS